MELIIVLTIAAILMAIAFPRGQAALDRIVVRTAAGDVAAALHSARNLAVARRASVAVRFDAPSGTLRIHRGGETLFTRNIAHAHGVQVVSTRDSIAYGPLGFGRGAANVSVVVRRRSAAETVFVSRLGRVR